MSKEPITGTPFANFPRAVAQMRAELEAAIARVLNSGNFVLGEEGSAFEREFATLSGAKHAVGVASGTDAIELALRALGIECGDEVITQANTCVPTVAAIARAGATPVLCDVDPETATMSVESLEGAVSSRTRAVLPVHLYGQCADMDRICALANDRGLAVVEDCAHALGARSRMASAGTHGELGAFSFYPTKNLGALGDAGAVVAQAADVASRVRKLRQYGERTPGCSVHAGVNSRLDELQAAVLRARLPRLEAANDRRRAIAAEYDAALGDTDVVPLARLPGHRHAFHLYVVRARRREAFIAELGRRGVQAMVHYPVPIHAHPTYRSLSDGAVSLEHAEQLCSEVVSLPLYPELSDGEVEYVATGVRAAASAG